jgi:hypothetical protein
LLWWRPLLRLLLLYLLLLRNRLLLEPKLWYGQSGRCLGLLRWQYRLLMLMLLLQVLLLLLLLWGNQALWWQIWSGRLESTNAWICLMKHCLWHTIVQ